MSFQYRKLGHLLTNEIWLGKPLFSNIEFLQPGVADHNLMVLKLSEMEDAGPKPFKFFNYWVVKEGFS